MSSKTFETILCINNYNNNIVEDLIAFGVSGLVIKVIDNWQYENEEQIKSLNMIEENINNGKIVVIEGKYKNQNCGCYISKSITNHYEFDIWISAKIDSALENEYISKNNIYIYDTVIDMLKKWVAPHELIFCVSGIEMLVEYCDDLAQILDNSSGILQMICSCKSIKPSNMSFNIRQDGDYMIVRP